MCRSIKTLRGQQPTADQIHAAALQYVRKVSGYRMPSRRNAPAFDAAVADVASATARLLGQLLATPELPPNTRSPAGEPAQRDAGGRTNG